VRTLLNVHPATSGECILNGKDILKYKGEECRLSRKHIQMVFQDPNTAFNPKMLVKDIICEPLRNFGMIKSSEVDAKAAEMLRLVELPEEFKDRYPHSMSGGQRQRVGIARALVLKPEILVCDEATSALDVSVQDSVCRLLVRLQKEMGTTILFICHDLALVQEFSHKCCVMYVGHMMEYMDSENLAQNALHPYTKGLMKAVFNVSAEPGEKIQPINGEIPSPLALPPGCPFQGRCEQCTEICRKEVPAWREVRPGHWVACHNVQ